MNHERAWGDRYQRQWAPRPRQGGWRRFSSYAKTASLLAGLTALALVVGERLGGVGGLLTAGIFVVAMNLAAFWFSDRIALAIHGARPLDLAQAPGLHRLVGELSRRAGLPMPRLYLVPIDTPNAFATGRSPERAALAVTSGLLQMLDERELRGVLAHELAHVKNRDTLLSTVAATLAGVITYAVQWLFWFGGAFAGGQDDDGEDGGGLASLGLLLVAPLAATLLQLAVSRSREYGADATGAELSQDPLALASALGKLEQANEYLPYDRAPATSHLFIVNPLSGGGVMALFSTHPPVRERIRRLQAIAGA
ncbi:MAG: zinc metalloprotease HtpX [Myxococcales bacterium]|nr:zinc metalloprotease HtpX [Myxococcales bacterium]